MESARHRKFIPVGQDLAESGATPYVDSPLSRIVVVSEVTAQPVLDWLDRCAGISRDEVCRVENYQSGPDGADELAVVIDELTDRDIVIVAGDGFGAAADSYIGPNTPTVFDRDLDEFRRYTAATIQPADIPRHALFVVNSMPKSSTVWMTGMLENMLGIKAREQITVSHLCDIETDWPKRNNHGGVVLVRDLRDVVVSCRVEEERCGARSLLFTNLRP